MKDITLNKELAGLVFFNLFRTVHEPPKITLDFCSEILAPAAALSVRITK